MNSEPGIELPWSWHPGNGGGDPWLVVVGQGEDVNAVPEWARAIVGTSSALVLKPRAGGSGRDGWGYQRALPLVGATLDGGRVWDVLSTIEQRGGSWRVTGKGSTGVIAAYAALYTTHATAVALADPPVSHAPGETGPLILDVLRTADVPSLLGALAPRPLAIASDRAASFQQTRAIYDRAGASARLQVVPATRPSPARELHTTLGQALVRAIEDGAARFELPPELKRAIDERDAKAAETPTPGLRGAIEERLAEPERGAKAERD